MIRVEKLPKFGIPNLQIQKSTHDHFQSNNYKQACYDFILLRTSRRTPSDCVCRTYGIVPPRFSLRLWEVVGTLCTLKNRASEKSSFEIHTSVLIWHLCKSRYRLRKVFCPSVVLPLSWRPCPESFSAAVLHSFTC